MGLNSNASRNIDIVFCIDGTGSMTPCLDKVKSNAKKFYQDFVQKMTESGSVVDSLNLKVITFRDYECDGVNAMVESRWFDITAGDDADYETHLNGIIADGGGDDPENGLEAIFTAMASKWNAKGDKDRQVIVLFTDADAVPLKARETSIDYPKNMVDKDGLVKAWYGTRPDFLGQSEFSLKERSKRLVMFAPAGTVYESMQAEFNRSVFKPVQMDAGLADIDFDEILKIVVASASAAS